MSPFYLSPNPRLRVRSPYFRTLTHALDRRRVRDLHRESRCCPAAVSHSQLRPELWSAVVHQHSFTPLAGAPSANWPNSPRRSSDASTRTHARTRQKPEVMLLLTVGLLLCGPGLPVPLFFDMDGVLISSRFFLVNIFRVPFPSIPTSLSLTYRPPTHPRTRHLCGPPLPLRGSSVASRPTGSHGNCLSVFLLPRSHIEPRRLTDTQTHGSPPTAHAVSSAQLPPPWGRRRGREGGRQRLSSAGGLRIQPLFVARKTRPRRAQTNKQTLASLTSALISARASLMNTSTWALRQPRRVARTRARGRGVQVPPQVSAPL